MLILSSLGLLPVALGYLATATQSKQALRLFFVVNFVALWGALLVGATLHRACVNVRDYPLIDEEMRDAWDSMSAALKHDTQYAYGCCGFRDFHDSPSLPCPEEVGYIGG